MIWVLAQMSERMLVMYAGRRVEEGREADVIGAPEHPYTRGLIACVPHITSNVAAITEQLPEIDGIVPPITRFGRDECLFAPRAGGLTGVLPPSRNRLRWLDMTPTVLPAGIHL